MKKTFVALLAVLIALVAAIPASADQPVLWYDEDYDNIWPLFDCRLIGYDYTILVREIGHHSEELYLDKDGNVVKTFYKAKGNGYLFNEYNPALMVDNNYDIKMHVEMTSTTAPFTWIRRPPPGSSSTSNSLAKARSSTSAGSSWRKSRSGSSWTCSKPSAIRRSISRPCAGSGRVGDQPSAASRAPRRAWRFVARRAFAVSTPVRRFVRPWANHSVHFRAAAAWHPNGRSPEPRCKGSARFTPLRKRDAVCAGAKRSMRM